MPCPVLQEHQNSDIFVSFFWALGTLRLLSGYKNIESGAECHPVFLFTASLQATYLYFDTIFITNLFD